jgi:hypothetical protein
MSEPPASGLGEPRITAQHVAIGHTYRAGLPGAGRRRPHNANPGRGPERREEVGRRQVVDEQPVTPWRVQPGLVQSCNALTICE